MFKYLPEFLLPAGTTYFVSTYINPLWRLCLLINDFVFMFSGLSQTWLLHQSSILRVNPTRYPGVIPKYWGKGGGELVSKILRTHLSIPAF
jgi:hypothetical protein